LNKNNQGFHPVSMLRIEFWTLLICLAMIGTAHAQQLALPFYASIDISSLTVDTTITDAIRNELWNDSGGRLLQSITVDVNGSRGKMMQASFRLGVKQ